MDLDLIKWLNMVWGALEEGDSEKRATMLVDANSFLEHSRELEPKEYIPANPSSDALSPEISAP